MEKRDNSGYNEDKDKINFWYDQEYSLRNFKVDVLYKNFSNLKTFF